MPHWRSGIVRQLFGQCNPAPLEDRRPSPWAGERGPKPMLESLSQWLPAEGIKILVVLFLSFLIGLEREERKVGVEHYTFGGVRTFPLIGLTGYSVALL